MLRVKVRLTSGSTCVALKPPRLRLPLLFRSLIPWTTDSITSDIEWFLEKRVVSQILTRSRNLGSVCDSFQSLIFGWFCVSVSNFETEVLLSVHLRFYSSNQFEILTAVKSKLEFFESFSNEHMYSMVRWSFFTRKERGMKWHVLFPFFSKQIWPCIPAAMVTQYPMKGITIDNLPKQCLPTLNHEKF